MESTKQVATRPARVLIAVECDELRGRLHRHLQRFGHLWSVDEVQPVACFDATSIVAALATAVNLESDFVVFASSMHRPEAVATNFLDQRDLAFIYHEPDTAAWRTLTREASSMPPHLVAMGERLVELLG